MTPIHADRSDLTPQSSERDYLQANSVASAAYEAVLALLAGAASEFERQLNAAFTAGLIDDNRYKDHRRMLKNASASQHRTARRSSASDEYPMGWDDALAVRDVRWRIAKARAETAKLETLLEEAGEASAVADDEGGIGVASPPTGLSAGVAMVAASSPVSAALSVVAPRPVAECDMAEDATTVNSLALVRGGAAVALGAPKRKPGRPRKTTQLTVTSTGGVETTVLVLREDGSTVAIVPQSIATLNRPDVSLSLVPAARGQAFAVVGPTMPSVGANTGYVNGRTPKKVSDANLRAMFVAPLLHGFVDPATNKPITSNQLAKAWRNMLAGQDLSLGLSLSLLEPQIVAKYASLSGRTLRGWVRRVRDAWAEDARLAQGRRPLREILQHDYSPRGGEAATKRRDALVAAVIELYDIDKLRREGKSVANLSAAGIALKLRNSGVKTSERAVQLIIRAIPDHERVRMRGGEAAVTSLFGSHLLREVACPNEEWIMDNSWLRMATLTSTERKWQSEDGLPQSDYYEDFEFDLLDPSVTRPGGVTFGRANNCYLTVIIDACTRRVLAVRVWAHPVGAKEMLLVLREAMLAYGRPDQLYTDNGSEFNGGFRDALLYAGITHVHSKPYDPRGRGKVERVFRTIKGSILPGMAGFRGGERPSWPTEDLLLLPDVDRRVREGVERFINQRVHSMTRRKPAEHYDAEITVRYGRLHHLGVDGAAVMPLLEHATVVRHEYGLEVNCHFYYGPALDEIMLGQNVHVAFDPWRWQSVYFQVVSDKDDSSLEFRGVAEWYDAKNPPPSVLERIEATKSWRRERDAEVAQREAEKQQLLARADAKETARRTKSLRGRHPAEDVQNSLPPATAYKQLSAPSSVDGCSTSTVALDPDAPANNIAGSSSGSITESGIPTTASEGIVVLPPSNAGQAPASFVPTKTSAVGPQPKPRRTAFDSRGQ